MATTPRSPEEREELFRDNLLKQFAELTNAVNKIARDLDSLSQNVRHISSKLR